MAEERGEFIRVQCALAAASPDSAERATLAALGMSAASPVEVRPRGVDDAPTILLDPAETEADFRWEVRTPLAEGVRRAVEYYKSHGVSQTYTHLRQPQGSGS